MDFDEHFQENEEMMKCFECLPDASIKVSERKFYLAEFFSFELSGWPGELKKCNGRPIEY